MYVTMASCKKDVYKRQTLGLVSWGTSVGKPTYNGIKSLFTTGSTKTFHLFSSETLFNSHFERHGQEIGSALNKSIYTSVDYLNDANHVINSGTYVPELNGYVKLIGGKGNAKFAFVGLDRSTGMITTFHIKSVSELAKKAPSLGLEK